MILDFDDACWSHEDDGWRCSLVELLVIVKLHDQHAVLADPAVMLPWCAEHLSLFADYFRTRLAVAQPRANALKIRVSPTGVPAVAGHPPWGLNAEATRDVVRHPLRLVLENDRADKLFVEATVPRFAAWCAKGWIQPEMGGGSTMKARIVLASAHALDRWRTFFMFDSDRLHPNELAAGWIPPRRDGCQGYDFEVACASMPRDRWHRLLRRSIENYLPSVVLQPLKRTTTACLVSPAVGSMAHYYHMKEGLSGDGVSPVNPKKVVRAARSQGFWTSLPSADVADLKAGFGSKVSNEFNKVPQHHPWPADVIAEMTALADALQDAM